MFYWGKISNLSPHSDSIMIKISRPIPKGTYLRHRLFKHLDHMRNHPVIWVSAPAGSGKTTLVSSYVENGRIPCLWYQLDGGDKDLATFFYYMGQAAAKAAPRRRKPMPLLMAEYLQGIPTFALRYFEELYRRLKRPSLLVFDNYQEVPDDSPLHEVMHTALSHLPEGVSAIVISRKDPPSAFIRLQANQQMDILRWEEIRLTEEEARGIINLRTKKFCTPEMMSHLYTLCDGWAVGLVLLSMVVKRKHMAPEIMAEHASEEIFTYFMREIFAHLDQKTQHFFLTTAFLPKMTVRMAEELTENSAAGDILRYMVHNNYFISRQFHSNPVYEYHPLYRNFLLSHGRETLTPETAADIQRRAAGILEKEGQTEDAVSLLRNAADWAGMAGIIMTHAMEMIKQGRHASLREWLEGFPGEIVEGSPWLLYWKGMSIMPFSPSSAKSCFEQAFDRFQQSHDAMGAILAASGVINAITYGYDDLTPLDHWFVVLNDLAAEVGIFPNEEIEAVVIASMIIALKFREISHPEAETWERRTLALAETPATINTKIHAILYLFWHQLVSRGPYDALPLLHVLQRLARSRNALTLSSIIVRHAEAMYFVVAGLHNECMQAIHDGLKLSHESGVHIMDIWFYTYAATSFLNRMDCKCAQAWFEKMAPMVESWPNWPRFLYHAQSARAALIREDLSQALYHGKQAIAHAHKVGSRFTIAGAQSILAQVLRKKKRCEEALQYLDQSRSYAEQTDNRFLMTELLLIEAQVAFDGGNEVLGYQLLCKSLRLAREGGYLFAFQDDPTVTLQMCAKALETGIEVEHVRTIIRRRGLVPEKPPIHIENWPWAINIYTLGGFDLLQDGKPVPSSRKSQQRPLLLFKALIALGGREIGEDRIADLLWPDAEGDMAHHAFEMTLHRLRKLLAHPEAISFREGRVTLDERYCWVDAWAFERLLAHADESKTQGKAERARELVEKAIGLYRGSFLAGEREEPWMVSPSERLRSKYLKGVWWLGHCLETAGHWEKAAGYYDRCLEADDCMEEMYRRLMVCYKHLGKRSEALSVYQRCRKTLSSVLGVDPSPETDAIRDSILSEKKS
jgi:LuxR family maltose regulon positive regulatory protein